MNLFIDTHLNNIVIILSKNNTIVKEKIITNEKQNSKLIMPTIESVLENKIPSSITVVNGPGSFTGVRLGVTIAKTLAYTMKLPIRTITALECMTVSTKIEKKIVAFSDNNGYYVGTFDENHNLISDYVYLTNQEFKEFSQNNRVLQDVVIDYEKVVSYALLKDEINAHEVNPIYIKKIDVEK